MGVRRNLVQDAAARQDYIDGVLALKAESAGVTTADLGIAGPSQPLTTWDLFVFWHVAAMNEQTPAGSGRNAAHSGPAFLPWHRWMLLLLEFQFQRALGKPDFGLPYWDWASDGELPVADQPNQPIWAANCLGGNGRPADGEVTTGPFSRTSSFRITIETLSNGSFQSVNRALTRTLATDIATLPTKADLAQAMAQTVYDASPWSASSNTGMRNRVEGWVPATLAPALHNRVHVWIGGDMGPASSPNDPAFYMNHCNVDRIWAAWQVLRPTAPYVPAQSAPNSLFRHRRNDPLQSILTSTAPTPAQMLDVSAFYTYDSLAV